ncbi:MAG: MFS transporter, partial [Pseudomonadota bacterium]
GTWMNEVGAGWLMTDLSDSPLMVASVQAATTLPVFLFAVLAGAIADIVDRRRLLLIVNLMLAGVAALLALLVSIERITPLLLLVFTFLLGTGAAFIAPAWQAIVPRLVPRPELPAAIALNSMGINVSRAIGPALAGLLIVAVGIWSPFALNAFSFLVILAALLWWKPEAVAGSRLRPESIPRAISAGLRYVMNSGPVRSTLIRAAAFFVFASAYWAMLPLIAREVLAGGPSLYGILLAAVGAGAVTGAIVLPKLRKLLGPDALVASGTAGTALVLLALVFVPSPAFAVAASALAGVCWIAVLSSLHVSTQMSLPDWVRARGLSIFLTVFFGSMTAGSLIWGSVAENYSISTALLAAAVGALLLIPLTWRARLGSAGDLDLTPSMHWPEPVPAHEDDDSAGPVMIRIEYQIREEDKTAFVEAMKQLAQARGRGGAYGWSLMRDIEASESWAESWLEVSWLDHLRHHERVSEADRAIEKAAKAFHQGDEAPTVQHLIIDQ